MHIDIASDPAELGRRAGSRAITLLRQALEGGRRATLIVATGTSQYATLDTLVAAPGIAWERVDAFHLDEYVGIPDSHPASFRKYLRERFAGRLPQLGSFNYVGGDAQDPHAECLRLAGLLQGRTVDVGLIGIGENGHLAFNDPPADFATKAIYHVVPLDEACQKQQVGEGWFPSMAAVPKTAISMTIPAIMAFKSIVCSVPDVRKAAAVKGSVEGPLTPRCPGSILRQHPDCVLFLDRGAASTLAKGA
jgi:glucosamine-6-phosphate deaminase